MALTLDDLPADEAAMTPERQVLDRTPQPYQHASSELAQSHDYNRSSRLCLQPPRGGCPPSSLQTNVAPNGYFGPKSRTPPSNRTSTSPSDSGTEADDERPLLRALTAPPPRPRKGLKDAVPAGAGSDTLNSPLLTPSFLDVERKRLLHSPLDIRKRKRKSTHDIDAETLRARARQRRRERAEYARRIAETASLLAIGYQILRQWRLAEHARVEQVTVSQQQDVFDILGRSAGLLMATYALYLVQLMVRQLFRRQCPSLYFPAAADPAPLMYPTLMPVLIVLAMPASDPWIVLTNVILGISSMPSSVLPLYSPSLHWTLSMLPIVWSALTASRWPITFSKGFFSSSAIDAETLTLLFPLHQALRQTLAFLTTTSLLPCELHLLVTGLINLLLFSAKPTASILKALLWIGGLVLLITLRHVLRWSVSLARVPAWRFRHGRSRKLESSLLLCAINDSLGGILSRFLVRSRMDDDSDEELLRRKAVKTPRRRSRQQQQVLAVPAQAEIEKSNAKQTLPRRTSIDGLNTNATDVVHESPPGSPLNTRHRRHTLPTATVTLSDLPILTRSATLALSKLGQQPRSLITLTRAQGWLLRWLYALFTYSIMLLAVALPIRMYVGEVALRGREPFGWALGYLFGDLPEFRLQTHLLSLDRWIQLPERPDCSPDLLARAERLRTLAIGAANTRLIIALWCFGNIVVGLAVVFRLSAVAEVDTRRKVFHGMMVLMFLPTTFIDPSFVALAYMLVLAVFLLLDLLRASQLPPLSSPLTRFLAPYVDGRDHRGPIIISPIFLLIGCAIPLWLSLAAMPANTSIETESTGDAFADWEVPTRDLSMVSGVICVGLGDAAASLIGRRFGRHRWPWSGGKSLEGSAAFALAVTVGLVMARLWLWLGGWRMSYQAGDAAVSILWMPVKALVAAAGASFTEAVLTGGNDNVIVPVILWLLVRGMGI